jgi:predicted Zn-dependent peptidase
MRSYARTAWSLAALLLVAPSGPHSTLRAQDSGDLAVREVTLDNGMRFLIVPRPGPPTVAFVVQYAVGGVNEEPGRTGIVHLLEHMLFKGTTSVGTRDAEGESRMLRRVDAVADTLSGLLAESGPEALQVKRLEGRLRELEDSARRFVVSNELDRILSRNGARNLNATTTAEATTYFVELPANRAELWFVLEADRMANPVFREFYAEREVVMEERRMRVDTNPGGLLQEAHLATAFQVHPYGQPVVGHMADLRRLTRPDVLAYHRRYYGPRNAVVAIVGDLDPDQMAAWARTYFSGLEPGEPAPSVLAVEPPQRGERRSVVEFDAEPSLRLGWHVPEAGHDDTPALVMLSALLTAGRTSRLYQRLVVRDERLATFVSASLGPGDRFPQLFTIDAVPRSPHTADQVEAAVEAELSRLAHVPPEPWELEQVRNQVDAGQVRRLQSNLGLAFQLAASESLRDDWRATFRMADRIGAVTPEQVQHVVRRYLLPANKTVAEVRRPAGPAGAPEHRP